MRTARLITSISPDRIHDACGDGSAPQVGDLVQLDQGFTFPDGRPGGMAYCVRPDGHIAWGADVYDFEIEVIAPNDICG